MKIAAQTRNRQLFERGGRSVALSLALALCLAGTGCVGLSSTTGSKASADPPANVSPSITAQPASQSVTMGQAATFAVAATGAAPLAYQWQKNGASISGATAASYTTPATTTTDNGSTFAVVVSNSAGSMTSATATLTVTPATVAPSFTTQPTSQTVTAGQTATFTVVATGTAPLAYQWQNNGAAISGATAASYTTPATTAADNGSTFTVVVSNSVGNMTSTAATLTVNAPPNITTQPTSQTVTAGRTATFTVVATGTAPLTYQWQKNGAAISGATAASYTTPATTAADNGSTFTVVVSNSVGNITSAAATLTVNIAPGITTQPANQTVTLGQTATFSVVATGTAPLSYQWQENGAAINGATSASYTTPATTSPDNGSTFVVVVSNSAGSMTSAAATLTVSPASAAPSITTQPTSQTVTLGQAATFSVVATGTAPLSYQWYENGTAISGATSASYTTAATVSSDNGSLFEVTVTNSQGSITSNSVALTVNSVSGPTVTVDGTTVYQTMEGFGAAVAFQSGNPWTTAEADLLFCGYPVVSPCAQAGAGLSLLRFQIEPDGSYPFTTQMQEAYARGARIWGTPWTAPASYKTNGDVDNGGYLVSSDYQDWANYLSNYITTLTTTYNVPIYALSVQNEPNLSTSYQSMNYSSQNFHDFILNNLGPTVASNNPGLKIMMPEESGWEMDLASATEADANASNYVSIIAAHGYADFSPGSFTVNPGQEVWMTENSCIGTYLASCPNGTATDFDMANGLSWAVTMHNYLTAANINAWVWWWGVNSVTCDGQGLINDSNAGGACSGTVVPPKFWITGNFSRFVRPGWVRIGATATPASGVFVSAYMDPATGQFAVVVINQNGSSEPLNFVLNGLTASSLTPWETSSSLNLAQQPSIVGSGGSFSVTLDPSSVTTLVSP